MNTVYRRKTKQPLYLVSCYLVSCIYKCSCVYFWQHIFVISVCVCACLCLEAGFCFLHSRQRAAAAAAAAAPSRRPNAKMLQTHLRIVPSSVEADYFSFQHQVLNLLSHACRSNFNWARRDKTGAVPHWTTLRIVECRKKFAQLIMQPTPLGENVLSFKCVVATQGRFIMFYRTRYYRKKYSNKD